jgi:selenocysteine lyase/cysteine desulfurase
MPDPVTATATGLAAARDLFDPVPGYCDAASMGLPPRPVLEALRTALDDWQAGRPTPASYGPAVESSRADYARLVGVGVDDVAVGSQVSVLAGVVACSLPAGARVVCVEGDFTSMVYPFLVQEDRGVQVRHVPLDGLADAVAEGADLVAFSLVQSSTGALADAPAVVEAARSVGARTFCDLTQAAGWLPVDAGAFDVTACAAYKWLCCPRGTAFLTAAAEARGWLRPVDAGWYAGDDVWASCYGPSMHLAEDARRLDVSPAWLAWTGTAPALRLLADLLTGADRDAVRDHGATLADAVREACGTPARHLPVVSLPDDDGTLAAALADGGVRAASRAGRVRLSFHLWNDEDDVARVLTAVRSGGGRRLVV